MEVTTGAAAAGVSGLNAITVAVLAKASVGVMSGTEMVGAGADAAGLGAVSAAVGAVLTVEEQPGMAKTSTSRKTWMPTTIPKIFRIFIGGMS